MILIAMLLAQVAPAAPSAEAEALGLRLARSGTLATVLPVIGAKETDELVAAHPELSAAEREKLRATAQVTLAGGIAKVETAFAKSYAQRLTVAELRVLVEQAESAPARRMRAVLPQVLADAAGALGRMDFKGDTLAAFCRETGKLCAKAPAAK